MALVIRKNLTLVVAAAATETPLDLPRGTIYTQLILFDTSGTLVTVNNVGVELDGTTKCVNSTGRMLQYKNIVDHAMVLGVVSTTGLYANSGIIVIDFERNNTTMQGAIDSSQLKQFRLLVTTATATTFTILTEELVA